MNTHLFLYGLLDLPWWGYIAAAAGLTHVTIAAVTIFLHRGQTHRALELHPIVSHFFRLWLWLTTGMKTREWVAVHRKHHARVETAQDPHSPQIHGINRVLWGGVILYRQETANAETLERFHDTIVSSCPMGRIGESADMAGVAIYLASKAGAYVTGAVIPVDGGISTRHG